MGFKVGGAFTWDTLQNMTDVFLQGETPEACFEATFTFFSGPGFFSTPELRDYYLRFMCDFDCVSFGLLNKDSLMADYTDAVYENALTHRVPTFVWQPEGSLLPATIQ